MAKAEAVAFQRAGNRPGEEAGGPLRLQLRNDGTAGINNAGRLRAGAEASHDPHSAAAMRTQDREEVAVRAVLQGGHGALVQPMLR